MATVTYRIDFGGDYTGQAPVFSVFKNAVTKADITPPSISEVTGGDGWYEFDWDWSSDAATSILFKAQIGANEVGGQIDATGSVASGSAGAGAGSLAWLATAGDIINRVAVEVGLASVANPYTSTDPLFIQLRGLLTTAGRELSGLRDWSVLVKEMTITGDGANTVFSLPVDFLRFSGQSGGGWNRTDRQPFRGPLGSREWQYLKAQTSTVTLSVLYRLQQGQIVFYEAPTNADSLKCEYVSRYWAMASGSGSADKAAPTVSTDTVMFEPHLVERLLKLRFLQAKGLEGAGPAALEYRNALEQAIGQDPAPVLRLGRRSGLRLLDVLNVSDTGYGS